MSDPTPEPTGENERLVREHLWNHLTDGYWHDDCAGCLHRRVHGGTGEAALRAHMTPRCARV